MGKFVVSQTATGWKFHLKAGNGETIATSEVYKTRAACIKGTESVGKCALLGRIADLTEPGKAISGPKIELFADKAGYFRFRLRSRNGLIIAASEAYPTKNACFAGIQSVLQNAPGAEVLPE